MKRALALAALLLALGAAPTAAQDEIAILLTTPDANLACEQDFPGASYEANLVGAGYTAHYAVTGHTADGAAIALDLLCKPAPG